MKLIRRIFGPQDASYDGSKASLKRSLVDKLADCCIDDLPTFGATDFSSPPSPPSLIEKVDSLPVKPDDQKTEPTAPAHAENPESADVMGSADTDLRLPYQVMEARLNALATASEKRYMEMSAAAERALMALSAAQQSTEELASAAEKRLALTQETVEHIAKSVAEEVRREIDQMLVEVSVKGESISQGCEKWRQEAAERAERSLHDITDRSVRRIQEQLAAAVLSLEEQLRSSIRALNKESERCLANIARPSSNGVPEAPVETGDLAFTVEEHERIAELSDEVKALLSVVKGRQQISPPKSYKHSA